MKKLLVLFFCSLMFISLSCQLTSKAISNLSPEIPKPIVDITNTPALPTITPTPTSILPTKTPVPPTKAPTPTAIPTSEPLVITDNEFEADVKSSCATDVLIKGFSNGVFSIGGGSISMRDGKVALWCYGAKHKWIGTIEYGGYIFASDESDPMQFEIVKDVGYRFIGGVGVLTYPDGKQVSLYRPTSTKVQPTKAELKPSKTSEESDECLFDDGKGDVVSFVSPYTTDGITLDGKISEKDEWENAFCMDLQFFEWGDIQKGTRRYARWYVKHDDEFLYILVLVKKTAELNGVAVDYFWPYYTTGKWPHSDGLYVNVKGEVQDLANWDESNWYDDEELDPPGNIDGEAGVTELNDFYFIEIKRPLNSGDAYDWVFELGDAIGDSPSDSFLFAIIEKDSFFTRNLKMTLVEP